MMLHTLVMLALVHLGVGAPPHGHLPAHRSSDYVDRSLHPRKILLHAGVIDTEIAPLITHHGHDDTGDRALYILQMSATMSDEDKSDVESIIAHQLDHYIPHHAFIIFIAKTLLPKLHRKSYVTWIGEWHPDYKLGRSAFTTLDAIDNTLVNAELIVALPRVFTIDKTQQMADEWIVNARSDQQIDCTADAHSRHRIIVSRCRLNDLPITSQSQLQSIAQWFATRPSVLHVTRRESFALHNYFGNSLVQNDNPDGLPNSNRLFGAHGITGTGEIIGVSDSGISAQNCFFYDPLHPVLEITTVNSGTNASALRAGPHRKIAQYIVGPFGDNRDDNGHGSHVAGTTAGMMLDSSQRFAMFNGAATGARIAFFDIEKRGVTSLPSSLSDSYLPYHYALGGRVSSNSWGGSDAAQLGTYTLSSKDVDEFVWENKDALILFAAGNEGTRGISTVSPPATGKNVIAVGASVTSANMFAQSFCGENALFPDANQCRTSASWGTGIENDLAEFSSLGPTQDGRIKPDLIGPGMRTISAGRGFCNGTASTDLLVDQGTSMATPIVAGNLILVRQYLKEGWLHAGVKDPSKAIVPSAALMKAIAVTGSFKMRDIRSVENRFLKLTPFVNAPDMYEGFGRMHLDRVLYFADSTLTAHRTFIPRGPNQTDPTFLAARRSIQYSYCVSHRYSLWPPRFTLVWTDYPATLGARQDIIQDLDLAVTTSDRPGVTINANGASTYDRLNTVERVELPAMIAPGVDVVVTVSSFALPMSTQPFALVATGRIVSTTCAVEFPNGEIDPSRHVDQSLIEAAAIAAARAPRPTPPPGLVGDILALNFNNPMVIAVLGAIGFFILSVFSCCYCAIHYDDSCSRRICCKSQEQIEDEDREAIEAYAHGPNYGAPGRPAMQLGAGSGPGSGGSGAALRSNSTAVTDAAKSQKASVASMSSVPEAARPSAW